MKRVLMTTALVGMAASGAHAGGLERAALSTGILYEDGNYAEFSFGAVAPDVSGIQVNPVGPVPGLGQTSGDMAVNYTQLSFGYKNDLTDRLDLALILDQPIGADVSYEPQTIPYIYGEGGGSTAKVTSLALTALLRYELKNNVSVIGGVRMQQAKGEVALFNQYSMTTERETDFGYIAGVAWEKPEIAARVALTYQSEITHDFQATEANPLAPLPPTESTFSSTVPQSLTLEFQSGIAEDTLLFGSVRWVDWSVFDITPALLGSSLVDYDDDVMTYNLGVGRRFSDTWSGAITLGYEEAGGEPVGNLGPTDGYMSVGLAATYTRENVKVTGGVRYVAIGDAITSTIGSDFRDNSAIAAGIRIGYSF